MHSADRAWPGHTPPGVKNHKTVLTAVDLLPTLCAAAGVRLPGDYQGDGENLLAAFDGREIPRTRPIFWEWRGTEMEPDWWPRLAVREGDWKLAMTYDARRLELHHLVSDRAESTDVAREHPDVVARLSKLASPGKPRCPRNPIPSASARSRRSRQRRSKSNHAESDARPRRPLAKTGFEETMARKQRFSIAANMAACVLLASGWAAADTVVTLPRPDTAGKNAFYVANRQPLLPSPLIKLPIRAIEPRLVAANSSSSRPTVTSDIFRN